MLHFLLCALTSGTPILLTVISTLGTKLAPAANRRTKTSSNKPIREPTQLTSTRHVHISAEIRVLKIKLEDPDKAAQRSCSIAVCDFFFLHLLGAPAGVGLPHVGRRLNRRDELQNDVADTDKTNNGASNDAQHTVMQQDRADKDVKGAATDEGEEEGGVARDLGWDLEFEKTGGCKWVAIRIESAL